LFDLRFFDYEGEKGRERGIERGREGEKGRERKGEKGREREREGERGETFVLLFHVPPRLD
jgi:hypothetical protein